jgi:hypothetical protein
LNIFNKPLKILVNQPLNMFTFFSVTILPLEKKLSQISKI